MITAKRIELCLFNHPTPRRAGNPGRKATMKQITSSQALKKELKAMFGVTFLVTRGGRYYRVSYTDGPAYGDVRRHLEQYQDNKGDDITTDLFCGSQYVNCERHFSDGQYEAAAAILSKDFGIERTIGIDADSHELLDRVGHWTWGQWARRVLWETDLRKQVTRYTSDGGEQRLI